MKQTHQFFVSCARGLEDLLQREIEQLSAATSPEINITVGNGGVGFEAERALSYALCMWSRVASRVLLKLDEFSVTDEDELYSGAGRIDWSRHFDVDNTFSVSCFTTHQTITNSQYALLRIKDAIVDQFMESSKARPDVEREHPEIRISAYINEQTCTLYLDMSGDALHKRGYRQKAGKAPIRETLAAALLYRCRWHEFFKRNDPFYDPMCGSGTLLIEAAMMAADIAPGLLRLASNNPLSFGFLKWKQHDADTWTVICEQAKLRKATGLDMLPLIVGSDIDKRALSLARQHIVAAGFENKIRLFQHDASQTPSTQISDLLDGRTGLMLTNPPYGKRLGEQQQLRALYHRFGQQLKQYYSGWSAAVITSDADLASSIGLRAYRKNTFFNGPIKSTLFQYKINAPVDQLHIKTDDGQGSASHEDTAQVNQHALAFKNRLLKNFRHLRKWAKRNNIECYRVYDADIPQYAVAIDLYSDWVHVQEYQAPKTVDKHKAFLRINDVINVVAEVLETTEDKVVLKLRQRQKGSSQYEKQDQQNRTLLVKENNLEFIVNLHDYLDTGLFIDHRDTRQLVRLLAKDARFLNLFAYTGSVTVYAAAGGARSTTTIDMSNTYLTWAEKNMKRNGFSGKAHEFIREDCMKWLSNAEHSDARYDLIFIDPPTFSNSKKMDSTLDIVRDHVTMLRHCLSLLSDNGRIIFSTNAKGFVLSDEIASSCYLRDITKQTTSEDFKRKPLHQCWCLARREDLLTSLFR